MQRYNKLIDKIKIRQTSNLRLRIRSVIGNGWYGVELIIDTDK